MKIELELTDIRTLLEVVRVKQDMCKKIDKYDKVYPIYHELDLKLERIKMQIANQLP